MHDSLTGNCDDPRAVLAVRMSHERDVRLLMQQALLANPEFKLVKEHPEHPFELEFYSTIYGPKTFHHANAWGVSRDNEALIARCADVATCNRVAAMFHAVSPTDSTRVVCGVPPATTGGYEHLPELGKDPLLVPNESSPISSFCGRVQACLARTGASKRPPAKCAGTPAATLRKCGTRASCEQVGACVGEELP